MKLLAVLVGILFGAVSAKPQIAPALNGTWILDEERCSVLRTSDGYWAGDIR